ncbi:MAG: VWA domain-containing protein [Candidatus Riflebacteria bacterium]|nr:VWA domain-containing protein [Candidatus Riflebacteria bacterium]
MASWVQVLDDTTLNRCCFPGGDRCPGTLETARGHLPLRSLAVSGRITGLSSRVTVNQEFVNVYGEPLEATYIFPLPERCGVVSFRLKVNDRVVEGVLKERGEARREYDAAIQAGHRAAIAEQERGDVFTIRAGNIPAGESVTVELSVAGPLLFSDGEATFRFPLVVAPRYMPGKPLDGAGVGQGVAPDTDAVPDASRISPPVWLAGLPNPVHLSLSMEIDPAGLPIGQLSSSLHHLEMEDKGATPIKVSLRPGTERLNRDFILRFKVGDRGPRSGLSLHRPEAGKEGTFSLVVVPPTLDETGRKPRDIVILLDRSGSMEGWKMAAARRAAGRLVDSLTDHDRFAILLFDDRVDVWSLDNVTGLVVASDRARFRAVEFLSGATSRGGTEMGPALRRAVECFGLGSPEGRERMLVLVTDGQVGNEDQLVWWVRNEARTVRVFTIGIDQAVNASFLRRLAEPTGGTCELVESENRLDEVMRSVHRRVAGPVLTGLTLDANALDLVPGEQTPPEGVDVFPGVPAVLRGRFRGEPVEKVTVRGTLPDGERFEELVKPVFTSDPVVTIAWAKERLRDLEHEYSVSGERDRAKAKTITEFSLKHGVMCRFTAFVAVDRSSVVNPGGKGHQVIQPVEMPEGWGKKDEGEVIHSFLRAKAPAPAQASAVFDCLMGPEPEELESLAAAGPEDFLGDLGALPPTATPACPAPPAAPGGQRKVPGVKGRASRAIAGEVAPPIGKAPAPDARTLFEARFAAQFKGLRAQTLAGLKGARTADEARRFLRYFLTDLDQIVQEMRKAGEVFRGLVEVLVRLVERFRKIEQDGAIRGPGDVERLLDELDRTIRGWLEDPNKAPSDRGPKSPRSDDFWM